LVKGWSNLCQAEEQGTTKGLKSQFEIQTDENVKNKPLHCLCFNSTCQLEEKCLGRKKEKISYLIFLGIKYDLIIDMICSINKPQHRGFTYISSTSRVLMLFLSHEGLGTLSVRRRALHASLVAHYLILLPYCKVNSACQKIHRD